MQLRRRSVASAKKARTENSASATSNDQRGYLLPDIFGIISDRLSTEDVARASLCCKSWALHLRAGIKQAQIVVCEPPDDKKPRLPAVESLARHSPCVTDLQLLLSSRSSYAATAAILGKLSCLQSLEHVTLELDVSLSPKKGSWPAFFYDSLQLGKVPSLKITGSMIPPITVTLFLQQLLKHKQHLTKLHLDWGRTYYSSQLPSYRPPMWLQTVSYPAELVSHLDTSQMEQLVQLTNLQDLTFETNDSRSDSYNWRQLSKLKALTNLRVDGLVSSSILDKFAALKKLKRLSLCIQLTGPTKGKLAKDFSEVKHVDEIRISLNIFSEVPFTAGMLHQEVQGLADTIPSNLKTLTFGTTPWCKNTAECLVQLTALTSLHLREVHFLEPQQEPVIDLTPLGRLRGIREFSIDLPPAPGLKVLFGWYPEEQPGARRSSRRLSQQQKVPIMRRTNDLSAMWDTVWTQLQRLIISGMSYDVAVETIWDMRPLTQLTTLHLQFLGSNDFYSSPWLELHLLPGQLRDLQLTGCVLGVQEHKGYRASLTSLSLSRCYVSYHQGNTLSMLAWWTPIRPLEALLQRLPSLQNLELINLHHLCNQQLGQIASHLTALRSLSVVAIGNTKLTHGGLLGLTALTKLRKLRWHVGDVLDVMPDLTSLGKMKGLVSLHIPVALHSQMQRWGGYAVLDAMPFCDVHVEAV